MKSKLLPILIIVSIVTVQVSAQEVPQGVLQAAEEGLPKFLSLMPSCGTGAVLGRPFQEYLIYDSDVNNYMEEDTIYDVLTESVMWYFPLMVGNESKCLLGVDMMNGNWEAVIIGYTLIAPKVALVRQVWPISEGYDPIFSVCHQISTLFFSVPQVDEYNLTKLNYYPPIESEDELTILYQNLKPLSETMAYIASELPEDENDNNDSDGGSNTWGCFISTAM